MYVLWATLINKLENMSRVSRVQPLWDTKHINRVRVSSQNRTQKKTWTIPLNWKSGAFLKPHSQKVHVWRPQWNNYPHNTSRVKMLHILGGAVTQWGSFYLFPDLYEQKKYPFSTAIIFCDTSSHLTAAVSAVICDICVCVCHVHFIWFVFRFVLWMHF